MKSSCKYILVKSLLTQCKLQNSQLIMYKKSSNKKTILLGVVFVLESKLYIYSNQNYLNQHYIHNKNKVSNGLLQSFDHCFCLLCFTSIRQPKFFWVYYNISKILISLIASNNTGKAKRSHYTDVAIRALLPVCWWQSAETFQNDSWERKCLYSSTI